MSLSDIVNVVLTRATQTPSQMGFGLPMILSYHTTCSERVQSFTSLSEMITAGHATTDEAYRAAAALLRQYPKLPRFLVGREENRQVQVMKISPLASPAIRKSWPYTVKLNGYDFTYTSDTSPTVAEICAGLTAAITQAAWTNTHGYVVGDYCKNGSTPVKVYVCTKSGTSAGSGGPTTTLAGIVDGTVIWDYVCPVQNVTAVDSSTYITLTATAAKDAFSVEMDFNIMHQENNTTDGGAGVNTVADLTACQLENDDWYVLIPTNIGLAPLEALAAQIETLTKMMFIVTGDDAIHDATSTTDLAYVLKGSNYARTALSIHHQALSQMFHAAWVGKGLPYDPGSITWKFKTVAGPAATPFLDSDQNAIRDKNCNMYVTVAGLDITQEGVTCSGEFIDVIMGIDFLTARMQEAIFGVMARLDKIPFTDKGAAVIENEIRGVLDLGIRKQILAEDPAPTVTMPLVADVSIADKANRYYPDIDVEGILAGAIHATKISMRISV
jgi:hypothetical protein